MKLVYQTEHNTAQSVYRCSVCKNVFFGGGHAIHLSTACEASGYTRCEKLISPAFVAEVKQHAEEYGDDYRYRGISLSMLRELLPEALEEVK